MNAAQVEHLSIRVLLTLRKLQELCTLLTCLLLQPDISNAVQTGFQSSPLQNCLPYGSSWLQAIVHLLAAGRGLVVVHVTQKNLYLCEGIVLEITSC